MITKTESRESPNANAENRYRTFCLFEDRRLMAPDKDEYAWAEGGEARRTAGFGPNEGGSGRVAGAAGDGVYDKVRARRSGKFRIPLILIGVVIAVVLLSLDGWLWWMNAQQYEQTDDAFIDTHIVYVSPQIGGLVTAVRVNDNQLVHKGDVLVEINSADAQARLNQIQAEKAQAETQYQQSLDTEKGAAAQAENAQRELARYRQLQRSLPAAVSQQQIDQATAADDNAAAQRAAAAQQVSGALAQINNYDAQLSAAQLSLGYTRVVSPIDGHIAQRSVAAGDYVLLGQQMLAIVPLQLWVTANFKETQFADMRVGQSVTVKVDACGSAELIGHIESIQRGAGQAFEILPPENATGNYVKVVQRVPVKIALDRIPADCPLGPGISVVPRVKVR
jgi:membrane fusion protein, multidrug efflux system